MIYTLIISCILLVFGCADKPKREPIPETRIKVVRPGLGGLLDEKLAELVLSKNYVEGLRICNDVLFSSRSNEDREIAYYWRTMITALNEVELGKSEKVPEIFEKGSRWWKSPVRSYHAKMFVSFIESKIALEKKIKTLEARSDKSKQVEELKAQNESLAEELVQLKRKNAQLERLLIELEKR